MNPPLVKGSTPRRTVQSWDLQTSPPSAYYEAARYLGWWRTAMGASSQDNRARISRIDFPTSRPFGYPSGVCRRKFLRGWKRNM
jgi:hypothetical protein